MVKIENDCCGCAVPAYPCMGDSCPLINVKHYYCDECGSEDKLYDTDFGEICESCLLKKFPIVEGSNY